MALSSRVRKLALTAHVTTSIGWLGAVGVFLALAIAGLAGPNAELVRSAYAVMGLIGWLVIVPLCLASLATGIASSLGTTWGLLRHYWVVIKLVITALATIVLFIHLQPISSISDLASGPTWSLTGLQSVRNELVVESATALLVLLVVTALSIWKPQGRIRGGQRVPRLRTAPAASQPRNR